MKSGLGGCARSRINISIQKIASVNAKNLHNAENVHLLRNGMRSDAPVNVQRVLQSFNALRIVTLTTGPAHANANNNRETAVQI